mgnify:CR=1 FL=1
MKLTKEMRQNTPVELVDDETKQVFYLISEQQFKEWRRLVEDTDESLFEFDDIELK